MEVAAANPAPPEDNDRAPAEDNDDDDAEEDAGYSQIGYMSEGEDSEEEDEAEAREKTGRSREEVETGDHRARAAEGSAAEAEGAASWVSFSHQRPGAESLPVLELRGSMPPRRGARPAEAGAEEAGAEAGVEAGAEVGAEAGADGWTGGAFDFDDAGWSAAAESSAERVAARAAAKAATAAVEAAQVPAAAPASQAVTKDTPPLGQEAVDLIKAAMAEVQITPPPWVRRMQQLQKVQQMQAQMQQAAGGAPLEAEAHPSQEQWPQQVQHLASMVDGGLPSMAPPPAANTPSSISGVCVTRRVTAKQLAVERREWRAQRKRDAAASKPAID